MTELTDLEKLHDQLFDLQSQLAFQEDTIHSLNEVVTEQQQQIERLNEMMNLIRLQLEASIGDQADDIVIEKPPHY